MAISLRFSQVSRVLQESYKHNERGTMRGSALTCHAVNESIYSGGRECDEHRDVKPECIPSMPTNSY